MADSNFIRVCSNCKFFVDIAYVGECHRFPKAEMVAKQSWCGEFVSSLSDFADLPPSTEGGFLSLPVVDIPQTDEPKRKPGRPKKEIQQ